MYIDAFTYICTIGHAFISISTEHCIVELDFLARLVIFRRIRLFLRTFLVTVFIFFITCTVCSLITSVVCRRTRNRCVLIDPVSILFAYKLQLLTIIGPTTMLLTFLTFLTLLTLKLLLVID